MGHRLFWVCFSYRKLLVLDFREGRQVGSLALNEPTAWVEVHIGRCPSFLELQQRTLAWLSTCAQTFSSKYEYAQRLGGICRTSDPLQYEMQRN